MVIRIYEDQKYLRENTSAEPFEWDESMIVNDEGAPVVKSARTAGAGGNKAAEVVLTLSALVFLAILILGILKNL